VHSEVGVQWQHVTELSQVNARVVVWSVTPQLSERRGYCSPRQNNRTDGLPHPHPPHLENNMGQATTQRETRDSRQTHKTERRRNSKTE